MGETIRIICFAAMILFSNVFVFGQHLSMGVNGAMGIKNMNSEISVGTGFYADYKPGLSPLSVRFCFQVINAEFNGRDKYLVKHGHTISSYQGGLFYRPKRNGIEPYLGAGITYISTDIDLSGNALMFENSYGRSKNGKSTLSYFLSAGASFNGKPFILPYFEFQYLPLTLEYEVNLIDRDANSITLRDEVKLDKVMLIIGLRIKIF